MKAINYLRTNPVILPALLLFSGYFIVSHFVKGPLMLEVINSIHVCIGLTVIVVYFPTWKTVVFGSQKMGPIHHLGMGITCTWFSMVLSRMYSTLFRMTHDLDLLYYYQILGFISWIGILGGILHLTAPSKIKTVELPTRSWISIGSAFIAGCLMTAFLFLIQPFVNGLWDF